MHYKPLYHGWTNIAPQVVRVKEDTEAVEEDTSSQGPVLGMEVEIPFVPASQRKTTQVIEDSIVVVGQVRQKKRKRTKVHDGVGGSNGKKAREEQLDGNDQSNEANEQAPFDFLVVPNILDDNPNLEETITKKKKKEKQKGTSLND